MKTRKVFRKSCINTILYDFIDQYTSGDEYNGKRPTSDTFFDIADRAYDGCSNYADEEGWWTMEDCKVYEEWYESSVYTTVVARVRRIYLEHFSRYED